MRYLTKPFSALLALAIVIGLSPRPARAGCSTDTTAGDFANGTSGSCYIAQTADGEVVLPPTEGSEFSGVALPAGWGSFQWDPSGTVTVGGGALAVDAALARTDANYAPGRSLEFVATFGVQAFQHVGFGNIDDAGSNQIFGNPPWAIFSTRNDGTQVRARVANGGPSVDIDVGFACGNATCLGEPHRYRIDWTATEIDFYIDGALVHSETGQLISANMRPGISDAALGGAALSVDWMRMTPYGSPCAFLSRLFDGGNAAADWSTLTATSLLPGGTALAVETRTGNTTPVDGTWSAFEPLLSGATIQSPQGRYLQYRATLTTAAPAMTPELQAAEVCFTPCVATGPEICDGVDNNCDGVIDDGDPGGGGACDTGHPGICAAGTLHCQSGALACTQNNQPTVETCNGLDDNCNGVVDDGDPGGGGACNTGHPGICAAGTLHCQSGALACTQNNQPSVEMCNGLDDNCNGAVDEPFVDLGTTCSVGIGDCARSGVKVCRGDGTGTVCNATPGAPAPEVCDGRDNNCNGQIDEGDPGSGGLCNTGQSGVCAAGTLHCQLGSLACVRNTGPSPEACNGVDDDCNGVVDDGDPGGGASCNTGMAGVCGPGTKHCIGGNVVCQPNASSTPEVCNNLDDNCDGRVDEGNPGGGGACNTGELGVCAAGTLQCQGGTLQCVRTTGPTPEICNSGADEDCDGQTDELGDCVLCLPANTVSTTTQTKKTRVVLKSAPAADRVQTQGTFVLQAPGTIAPDTQDVTVRLTDSAGYYYQATIPAGSFLRASSGRSFSFSDRTGAHGGIRKAKFTINGDAVTVKYTLKAAGLDEPTFSAGTGTAAIEVGTRCFADTADACLVSGSGSSAICR